MSVLRRPILAVVAALTAACASGQPFGGDLGGADTGDAAECDSNADCWDGDPATQDVCTPAGDCAFLTQVKSEPEKDQDAPIPLCQTIEEISEDGEFDVAIEEVVAEAVHTVPIELGALYGVRVDEPSRLDLALTTSKIDGVVFVLLSECTNACMNRISWGAELCTPVLEPGMYYLVVFSDRSVSFTFAASFLSPEESCDGLDVENDC